MWWLLRGRNASLHSHPYGKGPQSLNNLASEGTSYDCVLAHHPLRRYWHHAHITTGWRRRAHESK